MPPRTIAQFHCQCRQLSNFAATLCNCAISLPIAASVQFHCRLVRMGNFIAKAGDHPVQFDNGAISMPPRAVTRFHCQCGQLSNFAATPCSCAISLPITATVSFHCRLVLLGNFIAKAGGHLVQFDIGAISLPPRAIVQFHCQCGPWSSAVLSGPRWCLVVLGGSRWSLVVLGGPWWSLVVLGGPWWFLVVLCGPCWSLVVLCCPGRPSHKDLCTETLTQTGPLAETLLQRRLSQRPSELVVLIVPVGRFPRTVSIFPSFLALACYFFAVGC